MITATAGRIAASATAKAEVRRTARERAGRTRSLRERARSTRVIKADKFSHQGRSIQPRVVKHLMRLGFYGPHKGRRDAQDVAVDFNPEPVGFEHCVERYVPGHILHVNRHRHCGH